MAKNTNTPTYDTNCNNCPVNGDICGCCKLLGDVQYTLSDCGLGINDTQVTLRQVNTGETSSYPLSTEEINMINSECISAAISGCGGEKEMVNIIGYNADDGTLELERPNPIEHGDDMTIDFGVISVELINKLIEVSCQLYNSVCAKFPPYADGATPGIGIASHIDPSNDGKPPVFITEDDPKWAMFLTTLPVEDGEEKVPLADFFSWITDCTTCEGDDEERTNFDVLQELVTSLCGKSQCFQDLLDLCDQMEVTSCGIKFQGSVEAECGFKPVILHNKMITGGVDYTLPRVFNPAENGSNILNVDLGGYTVGQHYEMVYDEEQVVMPCRGKFRITGNVSSGHGYGGVHGTFSVKAVDADGNPGTPNVLTTVISDNSGSTRGADLAPYSHEIDQSGYVICSDTYESGQVLDLCWALNFAIREESTQNSSIYRFDHEVEFIPECDGSSEEPTE